MSKRIYFNQWVENPELADEQYIRVVKLMISKIPQGKRSPWHSDFMLWLKSEVDEMYHEFVHLDAEQRYVDDNTNPNLLNPLPEEAFHSLEDEIGDVYNVFEAWLEHEGYSMAEAKEFGRIKILRDRHKKSIDFRVFFDENGLPDLVSFPNLKFAVLTDDNSEQVEDK
jgi:hypothetical protein